MLQKRKKQAVLISEIVEMESQYNTKAAEYSKLLDNLLYYLNEKSCFGDNTLKMMLNEFKYESEKVEYLEQKIDEALNALAKL